MYLDVRRANDEASLSVVPCEITLWNYIYHGNQNTALSFSIFSSADMHMNVIIITSIRISFSSRFILSVHTVHVLYPIQLCISISTYSGSLSM